MEQYLIDEYNIIEDEFTSIEDCTYYLKDFGNEFFECGQGYSEDKITKLVKIVDKFYYATIYAEIQSAKQDYGDRLYWVKSIKDVEFEEVDKPKPRVKEELTYKLLLTASQEKLLNTFIKENKITVIL